MARKSPVVSWIPKHRPSREPKFHMELIFLGQGKVIRLMFTAAKSGWVFIGLTEEDINYLFIYRAQRPRSKFGNFNDGD